MTKKVLPRTRLATLGVLGTLGWVAAASALDVEAARATVDARLGAVSACLSSAPADAHGGITLTALLSGGGAVRQVEVTRRGPHITADVARCAAAALRDASFDGAERDTTVVVRFLVSEVGGSSDRLRVRDVVVTPGGMRSGGGGSGGGAP